MRHDLRRLISVIESMHPALMIFLSKIWFRHVITLDPDQLVAISEEQRRMWFIDRPRNAIFWYTNHMSAWPCVKWHMAFHRKADALMFRMMAL